MIQKLSSNIEINYEIINERGEKTLLFFESIKEEKILNNLSKKYRLIIADFSMILDENKPQYINELLNELKIEKTSIISYNSSSNIALTLSLLSLSIDKLFLVDPSPLNLIEKTDLLRIKNRVILIDSKVDELLNIYNHSIYENFELENIIDNEFKIDIYYEDNHVIVVDKKVGLLSQKDISNDPDVLSITKEYLKVKYKKEGNVYLGLVQRLDRNVSGLMILSKTSKAHTRLNENRPIKYYYALAKGILDKKEDTLINHIYKDENKHIAIESNDGKLAILKYKVIKEIDNYSLVDVLIDTGRFHQIRFQLSEIGHPLYNDAKYDKQLKFDPKNNEIGLDAYKIEFTHPVTKAQIVIERYPTREIFKKYQ